MFRGILSMNRPSFRKVLECASHLALWTTLAPAKTGKDHRSPKRCRAGAHRPGSGIQSQKFRFGEISPRSGLAGRGGIEDNARMAPTQWIIPPVLSPCWESSIIFVKFVPGYPDVIEDNHNHNWDMKP
jgi:hypothetical protein